MIYDTLDKNVKTIRINSTESNKKNWIMNKKMDKNFPNINDELRAMIK